MKKILTLLLVMVLALTTMVGCDKIPGLDKLNLPEIKLPWVEETPDEPATDETPNVQPEDPQPEDPQPEEKPAVDADLKAAYDYIHQMTKDIAEVTGANYSVFTAANVNGKIYPVTWEVDSDAITIVANDDGVTATVNIPKVYEVINYTLKFTVTNEKGETLSREYKHIVPEFKVNTHEEYMNAASGDNLVIKGIVVAINSKSTGNTRSHLYIADEDVVGGYYIYQMDIDPVSELGIEVGMTVLVTGPASPYNGMQEIKGGVAEIISTEKKTVDPVDITDAFAAGENLAKYVGLPVTVKGVTIGGQELGGTSDYLYFTLNGKSAYVRSYLTDFPTSITGDKAAAKAAIESAHAAHYNWTADATGILILYSGNPYLIPMGEDCFNYISAKDLTPAEKVADALNTLVVPGAVTTDTTLELPLVGKNYSDVALTWTVDNTDFVIGEDGKLPIVLGSSAVTLKLTVTATCGDATDVKEFIVEVSASLVMNEKHAYASYINQVTRGEVLYLDGGVSGRYLTSTTDPAAAVAVYAEAAEGGYKLYILGEDGAKLYITMYKNADSKDSVNYDANGTTVFTYNPTVNAWVSVLDGVEKYLGTYKDFATISVSNLSYITSENTGVSQFPLEILPVAVNAPINLFVNQVTRGEVLYLDGGVSGRYLTSTTDLASAVAVYAEMVEGGFKFYILGEDGGKLYITMYKNADGKDSVNYDANGTTVFTYNPTVNAWVSVLDGVEKYLGTYKDFATISVSNLSYINADNTGVSQFPLDVLAGTPAVEEHTCEFVAGETVDPTCTEDGYTVYTCTCGKTENRDVVKATGHSHEQVIGWHPQMVAADCTTSGVDVYVCACGDTYTVEIGTDPDAHAFWGDEEIITEANCATQTNGLKKVSCANGCGAIEEQEIYYEYSHEWDVQDETAATCTTDGHYYAVCTLCEEVEEYSSEAQGHYNWYLTCGETGACMECGVEFTKQHNLTEATCTEAPFCYDCWSEVGEALGHNYVGGTCENCGEMDPAGHTCEFVAGETVDPTCTEAGYTVYTCEGCGATENRDEVAATGHVNTTENVVDATCTTAGSKTVVCACGETVSTETIDALGHDYADGICGNCNGEDPDYYFESTIPEVLASADGKKVIVSGVVVSAEAWNTTYKNMSVTIKDENGDTLYIFRLATQVGLGDTITVTGVVGSYNEEKQIAAGSTAVIDVVHGDNHTYVDGYCTVCNSKQPSAGEETTVCDFSTVSGTQYADETKTFGDIVVSTHNKGCHFNTQLRIYDSSTNNGWAILTSESGKTMSALTINMGYKKATLNVYASVDGEEWVLVEAVATTSTSYLDYTVDIDESLGYKYIKIDASGAQLRVAKITLTTVG